MNKYVETLNQTNGYPAKIYHLPKNQPFGLFGISDQPCVFQIILGSIKSNSRLPLSKQGRELGTESRLIANSSI